MGGKRLLGTARTNLCADLREEYEQGRSVRQLAQEYGRSYGQTHKLLAEAGTPMRSRGGVPGRKYVDAR